ncbi:paraquat-inducible protein A [Leisingera aquaemixtae]|uniref:paraquat-inducible protein A n=1 Tax=Leisingera aquaemixtae TaxID=1396826 RepID=UPI001C962521|nr:paraquat-inducible protein A [Leisingera aquaemixtae]MBY6067941.1 paraquat-inducible protein A [Leisingera aquaemixtae]
MEDAENPRPFLTAAAAGLTGCRACGTANPGGARACACCGSPLEPAGPASLQRVWAWLAAGMIAYVPANLYPMLRTTTFGRSSENTLIGGIAELFSHGSYGVALIVFFASIVIPVAKFLAIAYLAISVRQPAALGSHSRLVLYEVVEFIGRWSMIDVFVVAILTALVQLDFAAAVAPGAAAVSFALSVAFTMLAAQSFDPRLIWNAESENLNDHA